MVILVNAGSFDDDDDKNNVEAADFPGVGKDKDDVTVLHTASIAATTGPPATVVVRFVIFFFATMSARAASKSC